MGRGIEPEPGLIFLALLLGICSVVGMYWLCTGYFEDQGIVEGVYVDSLSWEACPRSKRPSSFDSCKLTLTPIELVGPDGQSLGCSPRAWALVDIEARWWITIGSAGGER